jgi:methylmalonyl-CoA mutase cobalamin-binding domain/chain
MEVASSPTADLRPLRRQRRSVVALVGDDHTSDAGAQALSRSLECAGVDVIYLGRRSDAPQIAASVSEHGADAVDICLAGSCGVTVLRELLRELRRLGRPEVGIVVHRVR